MSTINPSVRRSSFFNRKSRSQKPTTAASTTSSLPSSPESPHRVATASPNIRTQAGPSLQYTVMTDEFLRPTEAESIHDDAEDKYSSASSQMSSPNHSDVENQERKEGEGERLEEQMKNILKLFQTGKYPEATKISSTLETILLGKKEVLEGRIKKKEARIKELTTISEKKSEEVNKKNAVYSDQKEVARTLQNLKKDLESQDLKTAEEGLKELFKRHPHLRTENAPQQPQKLHKEAARLLWKNAHQKMLTAKVSLEQAMRKNDRIDQKIDKKLNTEIPVLNQKVQDVQRQKDWLRAIYEQSKASRDSVKPFDMTPFEESLNQLIAPKLSKAESSQKKTVLSDYEYSD